MSKREEYTEEYTVKSMIPAPLGLVAVFIDKASEEDGGTRSAEMDVIGFGTYEVHIQDGPLESKKLLRAGPLVLDDIHNVVPLRALSEDIDYVLELEGKPYGKTRYHFHSRHEHSSLDPETPRVMNNTVPPQDPPWPSHRCLCNECCHNPDCDDCNGRPVDLGKDLGPTPVIADPEKNSP